MEKIACLEVNILSKNIALLHFSLNFLGGAEKLCLATISALRKAGFSVTLVTVEKTDWKAIQKNFSTFTPPSNEIYFTTTKLSKKLSNPIIALTLFFGYLFEHIFLNLIGHYDLIISTFGDLIYSMSDIVYIHFPLIASEKYSQILPISNPAKWRFQSKLYNLSLFMLNKIKAKSILVNSHFIQKIVSDTLHLDSQIISPPVDTYYFLQEKKTTQRENKIITLSGYSPKRHLERIPKIANKSQFGEFLIIGKTDKYSSNTINNLKNLILSLEVEKRVKLLSNVSRPKLKELLSKAKIYLHPMPNEHFGTAIVEAMATGCIPIVDKSGGPWLDILDQKQGQYGYAYENIEEASKYVDLLLNNESLRQDISKRAINRSKNYDTLVFANKIVETVHYINNLKQKDKH